MMNPVVMLALGFFQACDCAGNKKEKEFTSKVSIAKEPSAPEEISPPELDPNKVSVPVELTFNWKNIAPLYQGFFQDSESVSKLAMDLGRFTDDFVEINIRWRGDQGEICARFSGSYALNEPQNLQGLSYITKSLSAYRNDVGSRFDLRLLSFSLCLEAGQCRFFTEDHNYLKGEKISPCVEINGNKYCKGDGDTKKEAKLLKCIGSLD